MTDRELLELAAKAYFHKEVEDGICSFWWDEKENAIVYINGENQDHNGNDVELLWIPLDEDGDALRLAVKLKMRVETNAEGAFAAILGPFMEPWAFEFVGDDACAATRLAITRVAADFGKSMP